MINREINRSYFELGQMELEKAGLSNEANSTDLNKHSECLGLVTSMMQLRKAKPSLLNQNNFSILIELAEEKPYHLHGTSGLLRLLRKAEPSLLNQANFKATIEQSVYANSLKSIMHLLSETSLFNQNSYTSLLGVIIFLFEKHRMESPFLLLDELEDLINGYLQLTYMGLHKLNSNKSITQNQLEDLLESVKNSIDPVDHVDEQQAQQAKFEHIQREQVKQHENIMQNLAKLADHMTRLKQLEAEIPRPVPIKKQLSGTQLNMSEGKQPHPLVRSSSLRDKIHLARGVFNLPTRNSISIPSRIREISYSPSRRERSPSPSIGEGSPSPSRRESFSSPSRRISSASPPPEKKPETLKAELLKKISDMKKYIMEAQNKLNDHLDFLLKKSEENIILKTEKLQLVKWQVKISIKRYVFMNNLLKDNIISVLNGAHDKFSDHENNEKLETLLKELSKMISNNIQNITPTKEYSKEEVATQLNLQLTQLEALEEEQTEKGIRLFEYEFKGDDKIKENIFNMKNYLYTALTNLSKEATLADIFIIEFTRDYHAQFVLKAEEFANENDKLVVCEIANIMSQLSFGPVSKIAFESGANMGLTH